MDVQIIGGSGFIGSYLIDSLEKKQHHVLNIDKSERNPGASWHVVANVMEVPALEAAMQQHPADWMVLLAAEHRDDVSPVSLYYDVNVKGAQHVVDAMEKNGINKLVFTSSVAVYGLNKTNPDESFPVDPFNHYGKSKWEAEQVLYKWREKDPANRTLVIIRPTVVFGPGNRGNVYNLLKQIASGKFIMIGNGLNKKSMAYVENVTAFMSFCLENMQPGCHIFNYADKPDLSTRELIQQAERSLQRKIAPVKVPYVIGYMGGMAFDIMAKVLRRKFSVSAVRVKKFCSTTQFSSDKAQGTGFKPPYTLQEGLDKTMKALMEN